MMCVDVIGEKKSFWSLTGDAWCLPHSEFQDSQSSGIGGTNYADLAVSPLEY